MKKYINWLLILLFIVNSFFMAASAQDLYHEQYRPQVHFSPKEKWMNDPNGMFFYKGVYHLFFQYYPDSTIWGPMHWGHAVSKDLMHWQQQPVALYPDSLGYIFSGSAVVDYNNTSGFAKNGETPIIAIFTSHNPKAVKKEETENESISYSLDEGNTWIKYDGNPVLKNPGIKDFRDPKVMWYEAGRKWIMTLAMHDRVVFYSSPDLKNWKKESEFGQDAGAHGGVWECPDLFPMDDNGKIVWVLIANINPGGPNKGSATQYFTGNFDGNKFTPYNTETKWIDYGPDDYAGITWSNTGKRRIFIGWMSNWMYANQVPTIKWRNAMTVPRELHIAHISKEIFVRSMPVKELSTCESKTISINNVSIRHTFDLAEKTDAIKIPCVINVNVSDDKNFSLIVSNSVDEKIIIGFDKKLNQYYIDRTTSGKIDFHNEFATKHIAPRLTTKQEIKLSVILDESSAELFADDGLTVMTEIFFPTAPYNKIQIEVNQALVIKKLDYTMLKSIWP